MERTEAEVRPKCLFLLTGLLNRPGLFCSVSPLDLTLLNAPSGMAAAKGHEV